MQVLLDVAINSGCAAILIAWFAGLFVSIVCVWSIITDFIESRTKSVTPIWIAAWLYLSLIVGIIYTAWRAL